MIDYPELNNSRLYDPIKNTITELFSISYIYPIQRYVISNVLDKINQIVVMPTGAGKSLCFHAPSAFLKSITIVVIPLLALLEDQLLRLKKTGIAAASVSGESDRSAVLKKIRNNEIKILFITPESIKSFQKELKDIHISHFVIDEAHCIADWGETFRPSYLILGEFIKNHRIDAVTAFTATASNRIIKKIEEILFYDLPVSKLIENPDRPNIDYSSVPVLSKSRGIINIIKSCSKPVVLYTRSRKRAEYYSNLIRRRLNRENIFFYHAGLSKEERRNVEKWFMNTHNGILTATSAFGLGIDKKDIRTVIHAEVPYSVEAYLQESGRAGRDKLPCNAFLLYNYEDFNFINKLEDKTQAERYENMLLYIKNTETCRRESLLSLMNYKLENKCTGCDICRKSFQAEPEGKNKIIDFVKKNKRRFTVRSTVNILCGKSSYDSVKNELKYKMGFGYLNTWRKSDIEEGINSLLETEDLVIPQKGFFKYKLNICRKL